MCLARHGWMASYGYPSSLRGVSYTLSCVSSCIAADVGVSKRKLPSGNACACTLPLPLTVDIYLYQSIYVYRRCHIGIHLPDKYLYLHTYTFLLFLFFLLFLLFSFLCNFSLVSFSSTDSLYITLHIAFHQPTYPFCR